MNQMPEDLEPLELSLLDAYREGSEPSPEVENRLFARLQAAIEIEEQIGAPDEADEVEAGPSAEPATAKGTSPVTTILVAVTAFAAGVALTVGLRGTLAQAVQEDSPTSSASMVAEDTAPRKSSSAAGGEACEVVEVPVRVEVPVPVPDPAFAGGFEGGDDDDDERRETAERDRMPTDDGERIWFGPSDDDDGEPRSGRTRRDDRVAVAPWGGSAGSYDPGTRSRRGPDGRRRDRRDGVTRGSGATGASRPGGSSGAGSSGASGSGPGPANGSGSDPGNGSGSKPGSKPDPRPPEPNPGDEPQTDEAPPDEPPTPEDEPGSDDGEQDCWTEVEECWMGADLHCAELEADPDACMHAYDACSMMEQECGGWFPEEEPPSPWCEEDYGMCLDEAMMQCGEFEDPQLCDDLVYECDAMFAQCNGEPPPPPMWPDEPPAGDEPPEDPEWFE